MKANHHIEEEKWALLVKSIFDQDAPRPGDEQVSAFEKSLADIREKEELVQISKKVDLYFELKKYSVDQAWEKIQTQIQHKPLRSSTVVRRLIAWPLMRIAAASLVAGLIAVAGYDIFSQWSAPNQIIELSASNQAVRTLTLPDGTLVSLNSDSQLKYPKRFGNSTREVTIEGEAFFEVKPNIQKPFIIHAGEAQIKVLGTSFNVSAYPNEELMEVIVSSGKVQVSHKAAATKQSNELILNPGDKGTLVYSSNAMQKTINENSNYLAWKTHDLIFRATSLSEVIVNLEKVYKVTIRLDDPELNGLLLTAHFNNNSLDFILKVIETTFRMDTQRINGQYILKTKF